MSIDHIANKGEVSIVFKSKTNTEVRSPTPSIPPPSYFTPSRARHMTSEERFTSIKPRVGFDLTSPIAEARSPSIGSSFYDSDIGTNVPSRGHVLQILDSQPNLQNVFVQRLLRQFVNLCCYYLWTSMLQS